MKGAMLKGQRTKPQDFKRKGFLRSLYSGRVVSVILPISAYSEKVRQNGRKILALAGLVWLSFQFITISAQEKQYLFTNIDKSQGLSHNHVICFLKDSKGFIWIGTVEGLCRFDGYSFRIFKNNPSDSCSLKDNTITDLFEDNNHHIWITAGDYFMVYDPETETLSHQQSLFHGRIPIPAGSKWFHVYDQNRDIIFANTVSGVYKYIVALDSVVPIRFTEVDRDRIISYVNTDRSRNIWIACRNSRLYKLNGITLQISDSIEMPRRNDNSYRFFIDRTDDLWIYDLNNASGIIYYDQNSKKQQYFSTESAVGKVNNNTISYINQDPDGFIWIGTDHGGINIMNKEDFSVHVIMHDPINRQSLCDNSITNIYTDPQGFIWIGSFKRGLSYYHKNLYVFDLYHVKLKNSKSQGYNDIDNFVEDRSGNVWIGTNGGGLIYFDRKKNTYKQYLHNTADPSSISANIIIGMCIDRKDRLWIGTYLGGLNLWDGKKFQHFRNDPADPASLSDDRIWDICEDNDGMLWIATLLGGINVFDPEQKKVTACYRSLEDTTIRSNVVFSAIQGSNNTMWFATVDGMRSFNQTTGKFSYYEHDDKDPRSLSRNYVLDIYEDSHGFIWAATSDGLNRLNTVNGKFDIFREKNGLASNLVLAITEDNDHNLWLSTSKGISKLTIVKDPVHEFLHFTFKNYDKFNGLQGDEFNEKAIMKAHSGELFFGGPNGFNIIDPKNTTAQNIGSNIVFTDFLIFNKSVDNKKPYDDRFILEKAMPYSREIRLKHKENVFTIEFTNLNFIHPERLKYMYRMDNFQDDWYIVNSRERRITYTNLNPGKYLFRVRSTNNDGTWNENEAQLAIIITPPWWNTLLARLIGIFFLLSIVLGYYYFRLHRLNRQKIRLEGKIKERTTELYVTHYKLKERQREILEKNLELEKHRSKLEQLVRERTVELEEALRKARESDRLKSAFLANMSHEIRTPMNAIVGFSSLLDDVENTPRERREYVELIHSNSESLLILINDILDLSLIEANQLIIRSKPFRLNELVNQIMTYYILRNKNSGFEIRSNHTLMKDDLVLQSDPFRVKQILSNFMSNACKFTTSGVVEFGTTRGNGRLNMYVRDTGTGINRDDLPYLFDRFRKLGEETSTTTRGAGLGLAISKRLADLLGGIIEVQSEPGHGSVFTFSIPYSLIVNQPAMLHDNHKSQAGVDWGDKRFLVVEDDEANYLYLKRILEKTRAVIMHAGNGMEALNYVESGQRFDVILMDIKMPGMDGIETLKLLKQKDPGLLILAQTAFAREEDKTTFREQGFDGYIAKPVQLHDLIQILEEHF
jgi:signal transduction histidine kinase/ligand-binding sensor domain-containing protein